MSDTLPKIGLGTCADGDWEIHVQTALEMGYRHVDTAEGYRNETSVGRGVAAASLDREDVFLATKTVHPDIPTSGGYDGAIDSVNACIDRLDTAYVDLLYVHWPASNVYDPEESLSAFQELHDGGIVRNVGVSNFEPADLDVARDILDIPLFANQIECHPLLQQRELREYAIEHDHWVVAYCPLARGAVFDVPEIQDIAAKHDVTPVQVSLAWLCSKENVVAIPGSTSRRHLKDNLAADTLELDEEDIAKIDGVDRIHRIIDREYASWR